MKLVPYNMSERPGTQQCCGLAAYLPLFLVFMSGFGFSVQGLIIKILEENGFKASFELIVIRGLIQSSVSYAIIEYNRRGGETASLFGDNTYTRIILALRALFGWGGIAFGFLAIEHLPIADASVILMQSPVLAAILSYIILGEPWRLPEFISTIVSMAGVVLIAKPHFIFDHIDYVPSVESESSSDSLGAMFGLLAALCAGSAFVMVRMLGTSAKLPWANVGFATALMQFLISLPLVFWSGQKVDIRLGGFEWGMLITGGVVGTVSQLAMTIGMQREKSASASAMRTSDVLFAFIWQALFTSDAVSPISVVGAALVMAGVMIIVVFKSKTNPSGEDICTATTGEEERAETTDHQVGNIDNLSRPDFLLERIWSSILGREIKNSGYAQFAMTKISTPVSSSHTTTTSNSTILYSRVEQAEAEEQEEGKENGCSC